MSSSWLDLQIVCVRLLLRALGLAARWRGRATRSKAGSCSGRGGNKIKKVLQQPLWYFWVLESPAPNSHQFNFLRFFRIVLHQILIQVHLLAKLVFLQTCRNGLNESQCKSWFPTALPGIHCMCELSTNFGQLHRQNWAKIFSCLLIKAPQTKLKEGWPLPQEALNQLLFITSLQSDLRSGLESLDKIWFLPRFTLAETFMSLNEWSLYVKGRSVTMTASIFADSGQGCGGRDAESSVSDEIGYYILKQLIVNGTFYWL